MSTKSRALSIVVALAAGALVLSACDSGATADDSLPPPLTPAPLVVSPNPPNVAVVRTPDLQTSHSAKEAVSPDPTFDNGFTIQITDTAFHPQTLVSACCDSVLFKNTGSHPVDIVLLASRIDSGPIAPGATWVFTPKNVQSIAYESGDGALKGQLQVQPIQE
jgi:hypothetical protein